MDIYIDLQSITFIYCPYFYIMLTIATDHEIYYTHNKHNKNIVFSNILVLYQIIFCVHTPHKHTTWIPHWNDVETTVSTSFQRGIHVVCLQGT